jgi:plastocyanin
MPTGTGRAVQVSASEYHLGLSRTTVSAGPVRVEYNLAAAEDPHDLVVVREDGAGPLQRFDQQPAESVTSRNLDLTAGTYLLFCDIADHAARGMETKLTVR